METNERKFPEQHAPDKNTDHAFVQVGKDGQPVIPKTTNDERQDRPNEREPDTKKRIQSS
jgi:hypothetical protein